MNNAKKKRLEGKGWKFGTVEEFLGETNMSDEVAKAVKAERKRIAKILRDTQMDCTTPALIELYRFCDFLAMELEAE